MDADLILIGILPLVFPPIKWIASQEQPSILQSSFAETRRSDFLPVPSCLQILHLIISSELLIMVAFI